MPGGETMASTSRAVGVLGPGSVGLFATVLVVGCHLLAVERGRIIGSRAVTAAAAASVRRLILAMVNLDARQVLELECSSEFDPTIIWRRQAQRLFDDSMIPRRCGPVEAKI